MVNISEQRWKPDTCECRIIQTFDKDNLSAGASMKHFEFKCKAHDKFTDEEAYKVIYGTLQEPGENRLKNLVYKELLEDAELTQETIQKDGSIVKSLKDTVDYVWSFKPYEALKEGETKQTAVPRALDVELKGTTTEKVSSLSTNISSKYTGVMVK